MKIQEKKEGKIKKSYPRFFLFGKLLIIGFEKIFINKIIIKE